MLVRDGILKGICGPHGGYALARIQAHVARLNRLATMVEKDLVAFGSPDDVARVAQRYADAGLTHFLAIMNFGGLEAKKVVRSMELFARHVMPRFA